MSSAPDLPDVTVTADDLRRKYAVLLELREGRRPHDPAQLRALATEFPGALRELDALSLEALRARHDALTDATSPPWVQWMAAYHGLMRLTLALKRSLPSRTAPSPARVTGLAAAASARWGATLDEGFVRAVHRPPLGRLGPLVFDALGARFGEDPDALWQALFPTARRDRFRRRG